MNDAQVTTVKDAFSTLRTALLADAVAYGLQDQELVNLDETVLTFARELSAKLRPSERGMGAGAAGADGAILTEASHVLTDETNAQALILES